jgi:predicted MFS family arabinose efflux permease
LRRQGMGFRERHDEGLATDRLHGEGLLPKRGTQDAHIDMPLPSRLNLLSGGQFFQRELDIRAAGWNRRTLLTVTHSASSLLALTVGLLTLTGCIQICMIWMAAFLLGCIKALDRPAQEAFTMGLAGPAHVANAAALNNAVRTSGRSIGPAIGGLLIASAGIVPCFLINAVSYAAVACAPNLMLGFLTIGVMSMSSGLFLACCAGCLQLNTGESMRGRVMALYVFAFLGTTPIGGPLVGWLAQYLRPRAGFLLVPSPVSRPVGLSSSPDVRFGGMFPDGETA